MCSISNDNCYFRVIRKAGSARLIFVFHLRFLFLKAQFILNLDTSDDTLGGRATRDIIREALFSIIQLILGCFQVIFYTYGCYLEDSTDIFNVPFHIGPIIPVLVDALQGRLDVKIDPAEWNKFVTIKLENNKAKSGSLPINYYGNLKTNYEAHNKDYSGVYKKK